MFVNNLFWNAQNNTKAKDLSILLFYSLLSNQKLTIIIFTNSHKDLVNIIILIIFRMRIFQFHLHAQCIITPNGKLMIDFNLMF